MRLIKYILILTVLFIANSGFGQDPQYSQFYANPMYLNPAFAGTSEQHRIVGNFRDQWPSIPGSFVSFSLSYDVNISEASSGLGFYINRDQAGSGSLSTTTMGGMYAYEIKIDNKFAIRPALGVAYGVRQVDITKLRFGDQLLTGNDISLQSNLINDRVGYMDLSTGLVLYSNKFWIGYSMFHLNKPNNSLLGQTNIISPLHSVHVGYRLPIGRTVKREIVRSLTIAANYKKQGAWDQMDIGMYYFIKPFVMGVWYRGIPIIKGYKKGDKNSDAIVVLAGVHFNNFKFAYSYDITISEIWGNTGGAHELSVIYEYQNPHKKRRRRRVKLACPKF